MLKISNGIHELQMQRLTFGPNTYGEEAVMDKYLHFLDLYTDAGGTSVDTARIYSDGLTEEAIGRWFQTRKNRHQILLTTKGGHRWIPSNNDASSTAEKRLAGLNREVIFSDIHASLKALKTDYTDVYLLHRDCRITPVEEIVDILDDLVKQGLARVCGVSNWRSDRIKAANAYAAAHGKAPICVSQINFSLAETTPERLQDKTLVCMNQEEYEAYKEMGMPVMAFSSQAKGFFAKLAQGEELSVKANNRFYSEENMQRFKRVQEVAGDLGVSATAVALGYLTCNPLPTSAVFSCRTEEQMRDTLTAMNVKLTEDMVRYLEVGKK